MRSDRHSTGQPCYCGNLRVIILLLKMYAHYCVVKYVLLLVIKNKIKITSIDSKQFIFDFYNSNEKFLCN